MMKTNLIRKNAHFFQLSAIAFLAFCCYNYIKPALIAPRKIGPATIILEDTRLSATLVCARNGNNWVISSGSASQYFALIANDFGKTGIHNFQDISLEFSADYSKGAISGIGSGPNGKSVPIGAVFTYQSQSGNTNTMGDPEHHTCTGSNCSCCTFLKKESGEISGCKCEVRDECHVDAGKDWICNHSVSN